MNTRNAMKIDITFTFEKLCFFSYLVTPALTNVLFIRRKTIDQLIFKLNIRNIKMNVFKR